MNYGLEVFNDNNTLQISSTKPPLIYKERGFVTLTRNVVDRPAFGVVTFTSPITTYAPPKVFVRVQSSNLPSCQVYITITGSPNNWTGFVMYAGAFGGGVLPMHVIEYVCCYVYKKEIVSPPNYGLELFDENGVSSFHSSANIVHYYKFTKKWTESYFNYFHTYTPNPDITIDADDFIDISSCNRGPIFVVTNRFMFFSFTLRRDSQRTLRISVQVSLPESPQNISLANLCIPICKFPISKYP